MNDAPTPPVGESSHPDDPGDQDDLDGLETPPTSSTPDDEYEPI